jgi:hypothetical protein
MKEKLNEDFNEQEKSINKGVSIQLREDNLFTSKYNTLNESIGTSIVILLNITLINNKSAENYSGYGINLNM